MSLKKLNEFAGHAAKALNKKSQEPKPEIEIEEIKEEPEMVIEEEPSPEMSHDQHLDALQGKIKELEHHISKLRGNS